MERRGTRIPGEQNTGDLHIASVRTQSGLFAVTFRHDSMGEPVSFSIAGAHAVALRLTTAAECAIRGVDASPRVYSAWEHNVQALVNIESFQSSVGPSVQLDVANFQTRTTAAGAMRIAARFAFASELASQRIEHEMREEDLSDEYLASAHYYLSSLAADCLVQGRNFERESRK